MWEEEGDTLQNRAHSQYIFGCRDNCPSVGVELGIGNDLAGSKGSDHINDFFDSKDIGVWRAGRCCDGGWGH